MNAISALRPYARRIGYARCYWRTFVRQFCKRILRRDLEITLPTGLRLHLPRDSHYASVVWLTRARADDGCEERLLTALRAEADFIDVGAHLGYYSLWCAPRVRRVHAFEPDPRNLGWLETNARRAANVCVVRSAVSDVTGEIELVQGFSSAETSVATGGALPRGSVIRTPCTRLDDYWAVRGRPDVCAIKVDVEGHENAVLRGADVLVGACRPVWLVEMGRANYRAVRPLLREWSYVALAAIIGRGGVALCPMDDVVDRAVRYSMVFLVSGQRVADFLAVPVGLST